jgi:hypothetical protein
MHDVFDADLDDAVVSRQGIASIEAEIEEDLLELGGIGEGEGCIHTSANADRDTRIEAVLEKALDVSEEFFEIGDFAELGVRTAA